MELREAGVVGSSDLEHLNNLGYSGWRVVHVFDEKYVLLEWQHPKRWDGK
jgi:hypothetical protein